MVAGLGGNAVKTFSDELLHWGKISQRSFRSTAAGVWVSRKSEAESIKGQVLGLLFDFGLAALGGIGITYLLSKTGRDHFPLKGLVTGVAIGSGVTSLLSILTSDRVKPKDAASNLSYMLSHALYGVTAAALAAKLGHPSLFDPPPLNNYLPPTERTSAEEAVPAARKKLVKKRA
ncbi:MAG: hypothetical protein GX167_04885 [Firmicutes bacterium]|nr:hypothetical protein [Bacillota bacterium]